VADGGRLDRCRSERAVRNALGHQAPPGLPARSPSAAPLLRGGAVELYHTVDIVPLAVSGATPIRYEQASCDSTGPVLDRTGVASLCGQQVQRRATVYGAGLVPAGLELRYAPHRGVRVVVGRASEPCTSLGRYRTRMPLA